MEVYYRIMYLKNRFVVCCLQDFDELDYNKATELPLKFDDEQVALRMSNILNSSKTIEFTEL